ncbi:MAG: glycosyltransferase, partial [Burkholderiales bacterium]|nr:glycosyltransferase [Burkholderiales bacterium]
LMPSRFEPCGLNQLYSLRYGTVPIVHNVGGLADTVIDATGEAIANNTATGFVFNQPTVTALSEAIGQAQKVYLKSGIWKKLAKNGMKADFTWSKSAQEYLNLYQSMRSDEEKI